MGQDSFFLHQIVWLFLGVLVFFSASQIDWRFLRHSGVALGLFGALTLPLILLVLLGHAVKGAKSWLLLGGFGIEPIEFVKLALIILLAKYFSRRHIEIKNFRHILVSSVYTGLIFILVALQPDFGGAIIVGLIWLGMVLFSGISHRHLLGVLALGITLFVGLWFFGFHEYQKQRIITFINPTGDIYGIGYNAYQSTIAVGSGELFGKGIGYGTQSKLRFLPEYQTDFMFAAFAEEWGFIGLVILLILFALIIWRILCHALRGETNFETLFAIGLAIMLVSHFAINVAMNIGLLPVTGLPLPFMSYGGSHLLIEFGALGILMGMSRYERAYHRDDIKNECLGIELNE